jgi:hypothetical protein
MGQAYIGFKSHSFLKNGFSAKHFGQYEYSCGLNSLQSIFNLPHFRAEHIVGLSLSSAKLANVGSRSNT